MTRALVIVTPRTTAKSKAEDRLIIGLVGFLWGVLLGGFATYWAPGDGDTPRSRQRAELCIETREDVRSLSNAIEITAPRCAALFIRGLALRIRVAHPLGFVQICPSCRVQ